ncbi:MAG: beta-ketoacyl synthase N-terminal-like domain-containing protein [Alphaproteobacteria bacterium]|nr:beta-ketoacyl synthase N-terminal-like domain-containing protein [Alphaproteobacteria bacterium]
MAGNGESGGPVAITGMGVITPLGEGKGENWEKLTSGVSGIHRITRFPIENLRTTIAGSVDFLDLDPVTPPSLSLELARRAAEEATEESGIFETDGARDFPGELFVAAPPIEHDWPSRRTLSHLPSHAPDSPYVTKRDNRLSNVAGRELLIEFINGTLADRLADEFGTKGSPITLTTACASGATAIQLGVEAIRRGDCPAALCIGTDGSIQEETLIRFSLLSALSTANEVPGKAAKPFSKNRDGFVMAEGAAAMVLEHPEHAKARGATILGYVLGVGEAADTFHRTRSNPNGQAIIRCMTGAIEDAGLKPDDVHYVNCHGTGTPENDKMECFGFEHVFGAHSKTMPVSSNKSMIGHTLTAAGAVEAAFTVMTIRDGVMPPTINYEIPDPALDLDVVPNEKRAAAVEFALSNSFGFGGQNVSLLFGAAEA